MITTKKYIIKLEYNSGDILSILILYNGHIILDSKILYNTLYDIINGIFYLYEENIPLFYQFPIRSTIYKYSMYANFSFAEQLYSIKIIKEKMCENSIDEIVVSELFEEYELQFLLGELVELYNYFGGGYLQ